MLCASGKYPHNRTFEEFTMATTSSRQPMTTYDIGRSCSVRRMPADCDMLFMLPSPAVRADQMVGNDRTSEMMPAMVTAPAPMKKM